MEFSYLQKIGGGLLIAAWLIWGSNVIGDALIPIPKEPAATTAVASAPAPAPEKPKFVDVLPLLAKADVKQGEKIFNKCKACHTAKKGAGAKVGPDLWNVVGRPKASFDHFNYSDAMKKKGGKWTYAELDHFIFDPRADVPGTKMTFAGLKKTSQRADVIAYLRTLNDSPPPLPPAGTPAPAAAEKPAAPQKEASAAAPPAAAPAKETGGLQDIKPLLASASAKDGAKVFRKCQACHNIKKGAGAKVGPDLYDVLSRGRAVFKGFAYSDALKKLGGKWTYDELNHFLDNPRKFVPGTKMTFAGLKKAKERADIIAFLRQHDDSPPPLP